jgi:hypothetical protein
VRADSEGRRAHRVVRVEPAAALEEPVARGAAAVLFKFVCDLFGVCAAGVCLCMRGEGVFVRGAAAVFKRAVCICAAGGMGLSRARSNESWG